MNDNLIEQIKQIAQENEIELEDRPNYSGRGMFGRTTHAFCLDHYNDAVVLNHELKKQDIPELSIDQMGKGYIIY